MSFENRQKAHKKLDVIDPLFAWVHCNCLLFMKEIKLLSNEALGSM
jgi:hypothetical protein